MYNESLYQPLITVITAVRNNYNSIERAIMSVITQSYSRIEYIIIDGASSDGTVEVLQKYNDYIDHWMSEPDTGIYSAWNKGLKLANGEWVCFLGADDYFCDPSSLEKFVSFMSNSLTKDIALVYGGLDYVDPTGSVIGTSRVPWKTARQGFYVKMMIPHVGALHNRFLFDEFGNFDESFRIAGDYEFLLRIFERYEALYAPDIVQAAMSVGGLSSTTANWPALWLEVQKAKEMHPSNRFEFGMGYAIATLSIVHSRLSLFIYKHTPLSLFEAIRKCYRKMSGKNNLN